MTMTIGVVSKYFPDRGYGFLVPDDGGTDVFLHATALKAAGLQEPTAGQRFEYDIGEGRNGKVAAVNLRRVE
jgi:CspA family cold shock protein